MTMMIKLGRIFVHHVLGVLNSLACVCVFFFWLIHKEVFDSACANGSLVYVEAGRELLVRADRYCIQQV